MLSSRPRSEPARCPGTAMSQGRGEESPATSSRRTRPSDLPNQVPRSPVTFARRLRVAAATATVAVLWASSFVGVRAVGTALPAGPMALARLTAATLILSVIMGIRREPLPTAQALPGILVCGVTWFGAYNILLNQAVHDVDAGTAAMLVGIGPLLIILLAGSFLHEGLPPTLLAGCATAFVGTTVIALPSLHQDGLGRLGWLLCVAAAAAYACGATVE